MSHDRRGIVWTAAIGLAIGLAACSGSQGAQGTQGPPGQQGAQGPAGPAGADGATVVTGTISGALTTPNGADRSPVPGATVSVVPDQKVTATTAADGSFSLTVPAGVYTVVFTKNPGITTTQLAGVSVVAGGTATLSPSVAFSPIALTVSSDKTPAGFSSPVNLTAAATGATGPVTYTWTLKSGPFQAAVKPALAASGATASFTTNTFAEMFASGAVKYPKIFVEPRPSFIPLSFNQIMQLSYVVTVTATDGKYSQTASATVSPALTNSGVIAQGARNLVPVGINLVGNDPKSTTWSWQLTGPAGAPAAKLSGQSTQFPSFVPTAPGTWTLTNGATTLTVNAGTYLGMGTFIDPGADDYVRCSTCHAATPPSEFALWKTSAHGNYNFRDKTKPVITMFQMRFTSGTYTGECMACHTLGFTVPEPSPETEPAFGHNGFADVMGEVGWSIPKVKTPNAWDTLDPKLKALAGVQCENCHGPLATTHFAGDPRANAPQPNFAAGTCLVCHDEPGHHEESAFWVMSPTGHSNTQLAMDRGDDASCGRCHAAQGYAAWRKQIANGVAGDQPLMIPPSSALNATASYAAATPEFLTSLGLDAAHVQPQTCEACHDSHMTRLRLDYASNDPTSNDSRVLRDGGVTSLTPAGFEATGVGMGALCMTCHNSEGGPHGDGVAPADAAGAAEVAPHHGPQADLRMGKNAYFVDGGSNVSKHAFVADTCVGCHMKYYPASFGTVGGTGVKYGSSESTNHTFKADVTATDSVCVNCHTGFSAAGIQGLVAGSLADLRGAILAKLRAALPASGTYTVNGVAVDASNAIVGLDVTASHGSKALALTYATKPAGASSSTITVLTKDLLVGGKPVIGTVGGSDGVGGTLADYTPMGKAIWNYLLVANDSSLGVHNPSFALDVLARSQAAVSSLRDGAIPY